jgi:hypothetical protein
MRPVGQRGCGWASAASTPWHGIAVDDEAGRDGAMALPPGPICNYGDSYGEIHIRTKYNTTLVTCGQFSTSSAAARILYVI